MINHFEGVAAVPIGGGWWYRGDDKPTTPVPSHLVGWLVQTEVLENTRYLEGTLACPCGSKRLEFHYPGTTHLACDTGIPIPCSAELPGSGDERVYWFGLKAVCAKCHREHLLFDCRLHGCDAFPSSDRVARWAAQSRPRLWPWRCLMCGSVAHQGRVHFRFESPRDFLQENEGRYRVESRVDAFGWFGMDIKCWKCGEMTNGWVGYETR
jgi:hypothetical protein